MNTTKISYKLGLILEYICGGSLIVAITLTFLLPCIVPPIDIMAAIFPQPYPTDIIGCFLYPLVSIIYQLSWRFPLVTLWVYSMYTFAIIYGFFRMGLVEILPDPTSVRYDDQ